MLRAAASGLSTEEIGERLNLSAATIRNYLSMLSGSSALVTGSMRYASRETPAGFEPPVR